MANSKAYLGNINIGNAKLGTSDVKLYLGDMLVYPFGSKVFITYDVATYNGTLQTAQNIVVTDESGNTLVENVDYVVTENNGGTNAGTYNLIITLMDQYQGTARTKFVINKVTPTVTAPTAKVLTYNTQAQELVNAGSTDYGTLKYSLNNSTWSTSIPTATNYGNYTVYYKVDGNSNVNDVAEQSVACSINEKQVTATVVLNPTSYTYNGSACKPSVTVKDGSTVIPASEYTVTYSNNVNAGTGTVTISDNVGGNYEVIGSATFTINKANGSVTVTPIAKSITYNGSNQALVTSGSGTGTMLYKLGSDSWSTNIPSATTAGTYTVYYKASASTNYEESTSGSVNCTITKANSSLSFAVTNLTVDVGETKSNPVTVNAGDGVVTYSSNDTSIVTVDNNGAVSGVGSGSTTVSANISSTSNYNSASTSYMVSSITWDITAKFNVTDASKKTKILDNTYCFSKIEIDGVVQQGVTTGRTLSEGEHIVKYTLTDPTTIGNNSFYTCYSLTSCTIGSGVTSIEEHAFQYCSGLTSIVIPDSVTNIGSNSFSYCKNLRNVVISDSVTSIGNYAFENCTSLTNCTIGSGVTTIGDEAFASCSGLTSIEIPDSVTSINYGVFLGCRSLTSCTIGSGVTSIGEQAFRSCFSLTRLNSNTNGVFNIPDNIVYIDVIAFDYCYGLTNLIIQGNGATSIGNNAFYGCTGLTSCTIGSGVTSIGTSAFKTCSSLINATIGSGSIGEQAFSGCSRLTSCTIGSGVTSIGKYAFDGCSDLTSITIPDSVTSIGGFAFNGCSDLTSCTIGSGVTSIGTYAFQYCSNLTSITVNAVTPPTIQSSTFQNVKTGGTLTVPQGSSGYDVWMGTGDYYLGKYNWTKVEQ